MKLQIETAIIQHPVEPSLEQAFVQFKPEMDGIQQLTEAHKVEVLEFLSKRPVHTVVMTSFIQDNGIESPKHRGKFFAYRDCSGNLEGIALIGHTTLVEARSIR